MTSIATSEIRAASPPGTLWRAVGATTAGTLLEWYDYFIYGTAAALVFGKVFFPNLSGVVGLLASYSTFAIGFAVRPIGAFVLAHLGDRIGRKPILVGTLWLMGISTTLIGVLPTYDSIGIWAPLLLIVCRILQGLGTGAEYSGAVTMATEYAPGRRGLIGAFPPITADLAILISSAVFLIVQSVTSPEAFMSWGWRVPFLLAVVGLVIGQYLRSRVDESPAFKETQQKREIAPHAKAPFAEIITEHPRLLLVGMGATIMITAGYLYQVWSLSYLTTTLGMPRSVALNATMISAAVAAASSLFFGWLSDKIGWRPVMLFGAICALIVPFPMFWAFETHDATIVYIALTIGLVLGQRPVYAVQPKFYHQLFPTRLRYSGIAWSREIVQALVAGTLPFIATALVASFGNSYVPVALLMVFLGAVTLAALLAAPREPFESD
ncbi:MAG TPA: MFS transporter [Stellaceae bacterium]|nr:MFS transporter [Stellaceae bacterium]